MAHYAIIADSLRIAAIHGSSDPGLAHYVPWHFELHSIDRLSVTGVLTKSFRGSLSHCTRETIPEKPVVPTPGMLQLEASDEPPASVTCEPMSSRHCPDPSPMLELPAWLIGP